MLPPAIFVMGPTAAGKTDLAIEVSKYFSVEIISVDSGLVYRGMDIGTSKPSAENLKQYPHHLVSIIDPSDNYSAGSFRKDSLALMSRITANGKIPLLVGGSMLYFKSLEEGLADLPAADREIRVRLKNEISRFGLSYVHSRLMKIDPTSAQRIHVNDFQRLQRAIEVYEITGKSITELTKDGHFITPYHIIKIILSPFDRRILHQRIAERYHLMIRNNFVSEVELLFARDDCHRDLPSIRSVGYRQAWSYLLGEYDRNIFIDRAIIATRQMAKRQITWLRSQSDGAWFNSGVDLPVEIVVQYLRKNLKK
ncbi:MAG: tRNA (adenosine(37)-N6)-dimethylallyltransferase MiaA [Piscirickettsiaceae bacterium]|nr:tRNA (adenosine(37)-N6)-dimethylallyltransferase MiaA [Piscirickettsiaceae bacterium]